MQNVEIFEIAGTQYEYKRLPPTKVFDGLALVSPLFQGEVEKAMGNANQLMKLFTSTTKVVHVDEVAGTERTLPLGPLVESKFTGKPGELMAFVMKCLMVEYGDFLPGAAGNDAVMEVANPFISLMDVNG